MDIIGIIGGLFGSGWGAAIAAVGGIVLFFLLKKQWKEYQADKSDKESKDQFQEDHEAGVKEQKKNEDQANESKAKADAEI